MMEHPKTFGELRKQGGYYGEPGSGWRMGSA